MNNSRGSILIMTLVVLFSVLGLILAGTAWFISFSQESTSLEASLTARHIASSGLAYYSVNSTDLNQWIKMESGEFFLESVQGSQAGKQIRCTARTTGHPRHRANFIMIGRYAKSGERWTLQSFFPEGK